MPEDDRTTLPMTSPQPQRPPARGRDCAGLLSQLLFAGLGIANFCWCGWCMGKLNFEGAFLISVILAMFFSVNYGWKAIRYFKRIQQQPLSARFKYISVAVWAAVVLPAVLTAKNLGTLEASLLLTALLYLFFVQLSLLQAMTRPRLIAAVVLNTVVGLLGWGLTVPSCIAAYTSLTGTAIDISLPFSPTLATLAAGGALILAAYLLRLEIYHRVSDEPRTALFKSVHFWIGVVIFGLSLHYCHSSQNKISAALAAAQAEYQKTAAVNSALPAEPPLHEPAIETSLKALVADWNAAITAAAQEVRADNSGRYTSELPNFIQNVGTGSQAARWQLPLPAPVQQSLELLESKLSPLYAETDRLTAAVIERGGRWDCYAPLRLAFFRFSAAIARQDGGAARAAWLQIGGIAHRHLFVSAAEPPAINLWDWINATEIFLESPFMNDADFDYLAAEIRELDALLGSSEAPVIAELIRHSTEDLAADRARFTAYQRFFPAGRLALDAAELSLMNYVAPVESCSALPAALPPVLKIHPEISQEVTVLRASGIFKRRLHSRLRALEISAALVRCQRVKHALPQSLPELVPEFLPALPVDPLAPETPYIMKNEPVKVKFREIEPGTGAGAMEGPGRLVISSQGPSVLILYQSPK